MVGTTHTALRFADQDDRTLSLLAQVQRETGYVPTMGELTQLLQCPTTAAARQCLDELVSAGEGTHLNPTEQQELQEIAEEVRHNAVSRLRRGLTFHPLRDHDS
ncbi:MAG: hypothetical protein ACYDBB_01285 [Armatimonadota bacterium]